MSIIEKAVNSLGKNDKSGETDEIASGSSQRQPTDTVQRSEHTGAVAKTQRSSEQLQQSPVERSTAPRTQAGIRTGDNPRFAKIPFKELRDQGMLTPQIPRSAIAEEYRTIKRPLLTNITGDSVTPPIPHGNLIMVTSALEGDGKTFSSISLALSIAMEQDKTVLFVDADTAKAEAGRVLGVPTDAPGLIEMLESSSSVPEDYIIETNVEKFRILPAGDLHTHANELLASDRMRQLMVQLSEEEPDRVIVFDSPPLLLTTESAVLAGFMGQIVFVVSADMTPQYAVTQAIEYIGEDKMVGMVLNRARRRHNPYHYDYGYGRGSYGYGSREREPAREPGL